jgi:hypothetical protein
MSYAAIRDAIVTLVQGVSGIDLVYGYERFASDLSALRALYATNGTLHGWNVTRASTAAIWLTNTSTQRRHRFVIRGYYALDDTAASEQTFQGLIEAIEAAVRNDDTLGGTAEIAGPLQVQQVGPVMFAGVLCHQAELVIEAQELVT